MRYQVIILLFCGIRNSSQIILSDIICVDSTRDQRHVCCYNYEMVNGICTVIYQTQSLMLNCNYDDPNMAMAEIACKNGTTTEHESRCVSCKNDTYGYKCIGKCRCKHFHRCDPKVGCILKTSISKIVTTYAGTTQPSSLSSQRVTTKETIVTGNDNLNDTRSSKADWIIYTLCITSCFFLTGFGHLVRSCRKRGSLKVGIINENVATESLTPYMGDYNEVDTKPFTFVKPVAHVTHKTSNKETINFVFNDEEPNTISNEHNEAVYFDLYFAIGEDINHQAENRASQKEEWSTNSSISNVVDRNSTACHKLHIQHHEFSQKDPNACQVPVTVHQCIERSSSSHEDDNSNIYSNVCIPVLKDRKMNKQANETYLSSDSKTVHDTTLPLFIPSTFRNFYLQDETNKSAASAKIIVACDIIDTDEEKSTKMEKSKTF